MEDIREKLDRSRGTVAKVLQALEESKRIEVKLREKFINERLKELEAKKKELEGLLQQMKEDNIAYPGIPKWISFEGFSTMLATRKEELIGQTFQFFSIIYVNDLSTVPDVHWFKAKITQVNFTIGFPWSIKVEFDNGSQALIHKNSYLTPDLMKDKENLPFKEVWVARYCS